MTRMIAVGGVGQVMKHGGIPNTFSIPDVVIYSLHAATKRGIAIYSRDDIPVRPQRIDDMKHIAFGEKNDCADISDIADTIGPRPIADVSILYARALRDPIGGGRTGPLGRTALEPPDILIYTPVDPS